MLEMLLVFAVLTILSIGVLHIYRRTVDSNEAVQIHEDVMMRAVLKNENRPNAPKIFVVDMTSSGRGNTAKDKTRIGDHFILTEEIGDGGFYQILVDGVRAGICQDLVEKDWSSKAERLIVNNEVFVYPLSDADKKKVQQVCMDNSTFGVRFVSANKGVTYQPDMCATDDDCKPYKRCNMTTHECEPTCGDCPTGECCWHGECTPGNTDKGGCCPTENCAVCDYYAETCSCPSGYEECESGCC